MTDRQEERLVELLEQTGMLDSKSRCRIAAEELLANGVIVPPVSLNQMLWCKSFDGINQCKVSSLTQKADSTFKIRITPPSKSVFEITPDEIGKTVFLTKEEAEEKLKGLNNNA